MRALVMTSVVLRRVRNRLRIIIIIIHTHPQLAVDSQQARGPLPLALVDYKSDALVLCDTVDPVGPVINTSATTRCVLSTCDYSPNSATVAEFGDDRRFRRL